LQLARRENANPGVRCERKRQAVNIARKNAEAKGRAPGRKRGPQDGAARAHATRECPRHFSKLHRRRPRGFRLRQTDGIAFRSIGPSAPGRHRSPRHEGSRHGCRPRHWRQRRRHPHCPIGRGVPLLIHDPTSLSSRDWRPAGRARIGDGPKTTHLIGAQARD
jgi:hypothetical protein